MGKARGSASQYHGGTQLQAGGRGGQSLTRVCQAQDDFQTVTKVWDDGSQAVQIEGVS